MVMEKGWAFLRTINRLDWNMALLLSCLVMIPFTDIRVFHIICGLNFFFKKKKNIRNSKSSKKDARGNFFGLKRGVSLRHDIAR